MKASFRFCCSLAVAAAAMGALGYDDSYISADDESVVKKEVDGRVVYVFSTAGAAASVTLKQTMTLEEALVVGGGGAGGYALSSSTDGGASGGGGGGFVHTNLCALLTEGSTLALRVGGGGDPLENYEAEARPEPTGGNGGESSLSIGKIKIVAYGGGGGAGAHENLPGSGKVASSGGFRAPSTLRFDYADDGEGVYFTSSQGGRAGYVPGYGFAAAGGLGGGGASGRLTRQSNTSQGQSDGAEGRTCWITGEREVYGSGGGGGCGHVFASSGGLGGTHAGSGKKLDSGRKADGDVGFGGGGGGSSSRASGAGGAGGSGTVVLSFSVVNTTAKSFSVEVPTMYPYDAEGSACPFPVVRMGQETLVKDVDYELNYQDNTKGSLSRGWAWVKVVGKEGSAIAGLVKSVPFQAVKAYLVDPAATVAASGDTWATATTLEDAYGRASADEEIWMKGGTFVRTASLTVTKQLVFRGGFAADDANNLAKRSVGSRTVLDGNDALSTLITLNPSANIIDEVLFERMGFRRTTASSFYSACKQAFVCRFSDCTFSEAILNANGGSGAAVNVAGDTYSSVQGVVFEDCSFTGNGRPPTSGIANAKKCHGAAIAASQQTRLRLERCLFKDNGWPSEEDVSKYGSSDAYQGSCVYASGAGNDASKVVSVRAFDCRFIGNRINVEARVYGQHGGTVVLMNKISGDTVFQNCLFAANESTCLSGSSSRDGYGMLYLSATDVNQSTVTVDRCTFAYNLQNAKSSAAGLTVVKGRAFVTDSIFFGNMVGKSDTEAADLQVRTDGYVQVKRSLFAAEAETGSGYVNAAVPANLVMEDIVWGDPRFVTSKETFLSALSTKPDGCTPTLPKTADATVRYDDEKRVQAAAFDYHLLAKGGYYTNDGVWHDGSSVQSPAVWRNGREIVNLGAYAGTGEQSLPQKDGLMILLR